MSLNRAYSVINWKAVGDDDQRIITGLATSPTPDRSGDIVEPGGAVFELPIPLLMHHDTRQPIGHVIKAVVTKAGIEITAQLAKIAEPGVLKDRIDEAWGLIKSGLIRGLSIGFKPLEEARLGETWSYRYLKYLLLELSIVTIPANGDCSIATVKSLDLQQRAASGRSLVVARITPPGASGPAATNPGVPDMKTIAEQISAFNKTRAAKEARMKEIMDAAAAKGETLDQAQSEEYDGLEREIEAIDKHLGRLDKMEKATAVTAKPVVDVGTTIAGAAARGTPGVVIKAPATLEPGIGFARLVKVKMAARLAAESPLLMAQRMYGADSEVAAIITKANEVVAGTTLSGNWAADLVSAEGAAVAAFLEYLRPATILGKFGTGNVPGLTRLDFYTPYVIETGGGAAYWVGEGKPKPLTSFDYDRSTLTPLKIANIAVLTEENIKRSSPNSDMVVRNALVKALAAGLDVALVDPANNGTANAKPASITYGAETIVSTGTDADAIRLDVRAVFQKFIDANNAPSAGVWIMSATNALALSLMVNALGQPEFPGIGMMGGVFQGLPAIVSEHIGDVVALVNASDIFLGDEGGVAVDMSREASIEMRSSGLGMDATAGTATASSVSMFQTNSVALRAEREINWKRARDSAVAYLTAVAWGGAVPVS